MKKIQQFSSEHIKISGITLKFQRAKLNNPNYFILDAIGGLKRFISKHKPRNGKNWKIKLKLIRGANYSLRI